MQLVPQGAIPKGARLDVRLTPLGAPTIEAEECDNCAANWDAWGVTNDDVVSTNPRPVVLQNETPDPIAIRVELIGTLCPGQCIVWSTVTIYDFGEAVPEMTLTPDGCKAVNIAFTHSDIEIYEALVVALYAKINGEPFGETVILTAIQPSLGCHSDRGMAVGGYVSVLNGPTPPDPSTTTDFPAASVFPNGAFAIDYTDVALVPGPPVCNSNLTGDMSFEGGDPGAYGDFSVVSWFDVGTANVGARFSATGANDYSGITVTIALKWIDDNVAYSTPISVTCE